jgi:ABC-type oligopeptide transport system ATPase subunit
MKNKTPAKPPSFPRPICLEKCTMSIKKGYEEHILKTLKAFSNEAAYNAKYPHKLEGGNTWSIDVKARNDKFRMLFYVENNICKITDLCTDKTH